MSALRIFSRFAELLDVKITRAAAAWLRLNADGTVTERTAAQTLGDLGAATAAQGTLAASAVQPSDLASATVANATEAGQLSFSIGSDAVEFGPGGFTFGGETAVSFKAALGALSVSGGTMTGTIVLRTGSTDPGTAPLKFISGPFLSTAEPGAVEYSSDVFRFNGALDVASPSITVSGKNTYHPLINFGGVCVARFQDGYGASYTATTNYGFGEGAIQNNTGASSNGFGHYSLANNTGANSNGVGYSSLQSNTGAFSNGVGALALRYNTGANSNGVGYAALYSNTGANSNGFGYYSLRLNNWQNSIALGHQSTTDGYFLDNAATAKAFAVTNVTGTTITITGHAFPGADGSKINLRFTTTAGTPPAGLVSSTVYQFTRTNANLLTLAGIATAVAITSFTDVGGKITVTKAAHGLVNNACIIYARTSGDIVGLTNGTRYYVANKTTDTFELEASVGGGSIAYTSASTAVAPTFTFIGSSTFTGTLNNSVDTTNTIVIGTDANATKAHQVVLGNSSVVETVLRGNVLAPSLEVDQLTIGVTGVGGLEINSTSISFGIGSAEAFRTAAKVPASDPTGITGADGITNMVSLTAAEYAAITPNSTTLYIVT